MAEKDSITPEEIREIRTALNLTQTEAGEVLGGGPRAFAKYEAGIVEPSAGLRKLLRLLDANPEAALALSGRHRERNPTLAESPLTVTGQDIMRLREWELPQFLRSLLHAEAEANVLPADDIRVAEDYFIPDGGEDAHIHWQSGPDRTTFLPARYTQFQIKTGKITPGKAGSEAIKPNGDIKPMVGKALVAGAHYVLLCTTSLTGKQAQAVAESVHASIQGAGLTIAPERIHVWDADQLAAWTNRYPPVVTRLKERTQSNTIGPFRSWIQWADRREHVLSPFVNDNRLAELQTRLVGDLCHPGTVVRVVGPAGVGKSRLVLESLDTTDPQGQPMREFVLYADQSETEETAICGAVRELTDAGTRAMVVVDDCAPETHQRLAGMTAAPRSRLSLVTIDNDEAHSASTHDTSTVHVERAPAEITESIIDRELPGIPSEDRRRLLLFSRGFPTIAVRVANAWAENKPMPYATDDYFVNAFVTGRNDPEPDHAIRTAMLIAAFGTIRHTINDTELHFLASWGRGITTDDMHAALDRLIDRGVIQRRGGLVVLQPRPVAMRLTERQWREWTPERRLALICGDLSPHLKKKAARQLSWINDTNVANEIASLFLRPDGPLDGLDRLSLPGNADFLFYMATVDTQGTADCIRRTLDGVADLRTLPDAVRRSLVEALEKIAFVPDTFSDAAALMLRLAVAETEAGISNNATGQFAALFPMIEGATAADGDSRVAFLSEMANTNEPGQRALIVEALLAGAKTRYFTRFVGAEVHGSRPALKPWRPVTAKEASDYITFFVERLASEATETDEVGTAARRGLGNELRALVHFGLIDVVERIVTHFQDTTGYWPEAIEDLGHFLRFEGKQAESTIRARVRKLIDLMEPNTLPERIRILVSNMPWDYPNGEDLDYNEQRNRQLQTVQSIASDALRIIPILSEQLPQLCRGSQRWAAVFGEYVGARINTPEAWLLRIATVLTHLPDDQRNFDLLTGFAKGLSLRDPDAVSTFKLWCAKSPDLALALPALCARVGLIDTDVPLAVDALQAGVLPPWSLNYWAYGDVLARVSPQSLAPLFDELLHHGAKGFDVAVELIGMLAHSDSSRLEEVRPQLLGLAKSISDPEFGLQSTMGSHHIEQLFKWLLAKGRRNGDARMLALALSQALSNDDASHHTSSLLSPLLPDLLSGFPEIAWPLIGQQLVKPTGAAWSLREVLSGTRASHREGARSPILSLPPDTLFAWCSAHPDEAPACAARMLPVLASDDPDATGLGMHPLFLRLLDQFGEREDVLDTAAANIFSYSWVGSLTTYFTRYVTPLAALHDHPIARVGRWAKRIRKRLDREIEEAQAHDDEFQVTFEV